MTFIAGAFYRAREASGDMATAGLVTMKDFRVLTDGSGDLSAKRLTASGRQLMKYIFISSELL